MQICLINLQPECIRTLNLPPNDPLFILCPLNNCFIVFSI